MATKKYDPNIDYSVEIDKAIKSGASRNQVQSLMDARNAKIMDSGGSLYKYAADNVDRAAKEYIANSYNKKSSSTPTVAQPKKEPRSSSNDDYMDYLREQQEALKSEEIPYYHANLVQVDDLDEVIF